MRSDDELLTTLGDALTPPPRSPSAARVASLRTAVEERAVGQGPAGHVASTPRRRAVLLVAAAAAVLVAFLIGGRVVDDPAPRGSLEFTATLRAPDGPATAEVTGTEVGIGRIVQLETDDLPILPTGELYEVWFIGPGDAPGRPNRISAGTFHPDAEGRSEVELTAAVDPTRFPVIAVTAEPGDGDPAPSGVEVLRAEVDLR